MSILHRSSCVCCEPLVLGRRNLLAAAGATALVAASPLAAQPLPTQAKPHRIDVHHHLSPPAWVAAMKAAKLDSPPVNDWTPQRSLDEMDRAGIATSILSVTQPALGFLGAAEAASVARASNDYAASLARDHPGRFGLFAVLPMPHVDETLAEIAYALDVLKADGVAFMTSYGTDPSATKFLGDPAFTPIMEELNRRHAVAYTHPDNPACCRNLNVAGIPPVIVEYGTDTTRTIASLVFSGTSARLPNIEFIFSHAGGTVTSLTERMMVQIELYPKFKTFTGAGVLAELRRFHYDTAQAANPVAMAALTKMVDVSQILFGTDYPYRTAPEQVAGLASVFNAAELARIERANAQALLPRWRDG